jgi:hypothetical protein
MMLMVVAGSLSFFDKETGKGVGAAKILYLRRRGEKIADALTSLGGGCS